jgi:hypothetical protein
MSRVSRASSAVGDRNLSMAAQGSRGPGSGAMEISLTDPVTRPLTAEEIAERDRLKAVEDRAASVAMCVAAIRKGCEGPGCTSGHGEHVAEIASVLRILGLMPDPEAGTKDRYHYGMVKGAKK